MAQSHDKAENLLHQKSTMNFEDIVLSRRDIYSAIASNRARNQQRNGKEALPLLSSSNDDQALHTESDIEIRPTRLSNEHESIYTKTVTSRPITLFWLIVTAASCLVFPGWFFSNLMHVNSWEDDVDNATQYYKNENLSHAIRHSGESLIEYVDSASLTEHFTGRVVIACGIVVVSCLGFGYLLFVRKSFNRLLSCLYRLLHPGVGQYSELWSFVFICFFIIGCIYVGNYLGSWFSATWRLLYNFLNLLYAARLGICLYGDIEDLEGRTKAYEVAVLRLRRLHGVQKASQEPSEAPGRSLVTQKGKHDSIEDTGSSNLSYEVEPKSQGDTQIMKQSGTKISISVPSNVVDKGIDLHPSEQSDQTFRARPHFYIVVSEGRFEVSIRAPWAFHDIYGQFASVLVSWLDKVKSHLHFKRSSLSQTLPSEGLTRVEWRCSCGEMLFDDYRELQPENLASLSDRLSQIADAGGLQPTSDLRQFSTIVSNAAGTLFEGIFRPLLSAKKLRGSNLVIGDSTTSAQSSGRVLVYYLLLCMPASRWGHKLRQEQLLSSTTSNDRQLFELLKKAYESCNRLYKSILSIRTVTKVSMSHFLVDRAEFADVRPHEDYCSGTQSSECKCLPPPASVQPSPSAEYMCEPVPAERAPPIGPNFLTHYFHNPQCLPEDETMTLSQLPKRVRGMLMSLDGHKRSPGWGLVFEEGWDLVRISALLFIASMTSLLFGVLWSVIKNDVQGGFAISSYVVTSLTLALGVFATKQL